MIGNIKADRHHSMKTNASVFLLLLQGIGDNAAHTNTIYGEATEAFLALVAKPFTQISCLFHI